CGLQIADCRRRTPRLESAIRNPQSAIRRAVVRPGFVVIAGLTTGEVLLDVAEALAAEGQVAQVVGEPAAAADAELGDCGKECVGHELPGEGGEVVHEAPLQPAGAAAEPAEAARPADAVLQGGLQLGLGMLGALSLLLAPGLAARRRLLAKAYGPRHE